MGHYEVLQRRFKHESGEYYLAIGGLGRDIYNCLLLLNLVEEAFGVSESTTATGLSTLDYPTFRINHSVLGPTYIPEATNWLRVNKIGAPSFPFASVPTQDVYGTGSWREGLNMRWVVELKEAIGRVARSAGGDMTAIARANLTGSSVDTFTISTASGLSGSSALRPVFNSTLNHPTQDYLARRTLANPQTLSQNIRNEPSGYLSSKLFLEVPIFSKGPWGDSPTGPSLTLNDWEMANQPFILTRTVSQSTSQGSRTYGDFQKFPLNPSVFWSSGGGFVEYRVDPLRYSPTFPGEYSNDAYTAEDSTMPTELRWVSSNNPPTTMNGLQSGQVGTDGKYVWAWPVGGREALEQANETEFSSVSSGVKSKFKEKADRLAELVAPHAPPPVVIGQPAHNYYSTGYVIGSLGGVSRGQARATVRGASVGGAATWVGFTQPVLPANWPNDVYTAP